MEQKKFRDIKEMLENAGIRKIGWSPQAVDAIMSDLREQLSTCDDGNTGGGK